MQAGGDAGLLEPALRGLKSSRSLLCFVFAALYGSARFYFFMDVKTFITVQGQRRKACIETEPAQVATRDGLNLEVRANIADGGGGGMPFQDKRHQNGSPTRAEPADLKGVVGSACGRGSQAPAC